MRRPSPLLIPWFGLAALAPLPAFAQLYPPPASRALVQIYGTAIEPAAVQPGQTVRIHYTLSYDPALQPPLYPELTVIGLPANTVAAATPIRLLSTGSPQVPMIADLRLNPPAQAGVYPLSIKATVNGVDQTVTQIGALGIQLAPGAIVDAMILPGTLSVCSSGRQAATVRYTAEDDNGAATISRVLVSGLPPVATSSLPAGPVGSSGAVSTGVGTGYAAAPSQVVVSEAPGGNFVVTQSGPAVPAPVYPQTTTTTTQTTTYYAPGVVPAVAVEVSPPRSMVTAIETVTTPVTLPCLGADPRSWRLGLVGYVLDPLTNTTRALPPAPLAVP